MEEAVRRNGHSRKQDSAKGETITAQDSYAQATVLFANIVGFTSLPATHEPTEIILFLNGLFTRFDIAATRHGIEKIKTIGDGYMTAWNVVNSVTSLLSVDLFKPKASASGNSAPERRLAIARGDERVSYFRRDSRLAALQHDAHFQSLLKSVDWRPHARIAVGPGVQNRGTLCRRQRRKLLNRGLVFGALRGG